MNPAPALPRCRTPDFLLLALFLADTIAFACFGAGLIGASLLITSHAIALAAFAVGARASFERDATLYLLAIVSCGSAGPLGAAGILVLMRMSRLMTIPAADLQLWHDRLSGLNQVRPGIEIAEKLKAGRLLRHDQRAVTNFQDALKGPLVTQQRVLGAVGLAYDPVYRTILDAALASTEPSIRVHAAAVCVKLRNKNKAAARAAMQAPSHQQDAGANLSAASTLAQAARSGFLDPPEKVFEARAEALRRCEKAVVLQSGSRQGLMLKCELLLETGADSDALALADAHRLDRDPRLRDRIAESLIRSRRISELRDLLTRPRPSLPVPQVGAPVR